MPVQRAGALRRENFLPECAEADTGTDNIPPRIRDTEGAACRERTPVKNFLWNNAPRVVQSLSLDGGLIVI